jgi:thioredoxin-related protein
MKKIFAVVLFACALFLTANARAASNLQLAPNLSFTDDSSPNFPITGSAMGSGSEAGKATVIFFGTSNCWNTAREAERLVKLYPQYKNHLNFVVVDLNHVSGAQKPLVAQYYRGAIPTIAIVDVRGNVVYDRAGETARGRGDAGNLQKLLDSAN